MIKVDKATVFNRGRAEFEMKILFRIPFTIYFLGWDKSTQKFILATKYLATKYFDSEKARYCFWYICR